MTTDFLDSVFMMPDTLASWPWKRKINPRYHEVKAESSMWIQKFTTFAPHMQRTFDLGNFALLASLAYPLESKDILRAGCDLMHLYFFFDEYTDVATPHEARQMATVVMDAIRNPDKARPAGESIVGEVARQFWKLSSKFGCESARRGFIETFEEYTTSVAQQAQDRAQNHIRTIDDYLLVRRKTIGAHPSFALLRFELNLPDEVLDDPVIRRLTTACVDMILIGNDLCSYNIEQARGDEGHNIVTIVMHNNNLGLSEAMSWIDKYHAKLVDNFLNDLHDVPSFGEEYQSGVDHYLDGLGNWVRANDCWSFESHRYFANDGLEIQRSRKVVLLPRSGF